MRPENDPNWKGGRDYHLDVGGGYAVSWQFNGQTPVYALWKGNEALSYSSDYQQIRETYREHSRRDLPEGAKPTAPTPLRPPAAQGVTGVRL